MPKTEKMKYTNEDEKENIRTAFKVFLTQNGLNLQKLVNGFTDKKYGAVYAKINQCHISHEYIEGLAKLVKPSAKLEKFGSSFMFTFKNK